MVDMLGFRNMSVPAKFPRDRACEILGISLLAVTCFLFFALASIHYQGTVPLDDLGAAFNLCGRPGAYTAGFLSVLLGHAAHVLYIMTGVWAMMLIWHRPLDRLALRLAGLLLLSGSAAGLLHIHLFSSALEGLPGGVIGAYVGRLLLPTFGRIGSDVIAATLGIVGILLATEFLFVRVAAWFYFIAVQIIRASNALYSLLGRAWQRHAEAAALRRKRDEKPLRGIHGVFHEPDPPSDVAESVPMTAQMDAAFTREETPAVQERPERAPARIRIRTAPPPVEIVQEEIPFHAVSEPVETDTAPPETTRISLPAPEEVKRDEPAAMGTNGAATPVYKPRAARPMPRRKNAELDELPPDYVYPRHYKKPSLDLLELAPPPRSPELLTESLHQTSLLLERTLETFGIEARVTDITRGPTITRFELEPAPGIKVNRFTSLADDLALALKADGVRVEAPIPGKGRVGIELPNIDREPVVLRELLQSKTYRKTKGPLVLALGKDIAGDVIATDLAVMPHLLIAGATGKGKTVCVKSILASLLFMKTPEEVQLMLIDPKMVEFSIFNDIPHLITPVVTEPKKAATALNWLITEMEERYRLFAQLRVRNIEVYNESVENGEIEMPDEEGNAAGESVNLVRKLPYIVCVIDELADLMMLARAEVEDAIMRLAQLARAVGIHLIIATQRPSVNVLTGVIKANFPVRISFQVSSRTDSRCILDEIGAERLIGNGDMLYLPAGRSVPVRIQGAFVSDHEMNSLVGYLKTQAPPQYRDEIENFGKSREELEEELNAEADELFDEAVRVVLETGQASISMVQRRLRVGYTRAARLIDMMELKGIVGPHLGSKAREILVDYAPGDREP